MTSFKRTPDAHGEPPKVPTVFVTEPEESIAATGIGTGEPVVDESSPALKAQADALKAKMAGGKDDAADYYMDKLVAYFKHEGPKPTDGETAAAVHAVGGDNIQNVITGALGVAGIDKLAVTAEEWQAYFKSR